MSYHNTIAHTVRRLVATSTTDELIRYVQRQVGESYTRGYAAGYYRWEGTTLVALVWRSMRRGTRRVIRRLLRRMRYHWISEERVKARQGIGRDYPR